MPIAGGGNSISVPVSLRLEVLQSSLAKLQNQLDKLSPNSKRFKELQTIISSITHEMDKITLQTAKPFGDQSQFAQTEKSINNIEESFRKVELVLNKINFSDLKLDATQQTELKKFSDEIERIKNQFDSFKERKKLDLLGDTDFEGFKKLLNSTDLNNTFDGLIKIIDKKRIDIINKYENLQRDIQIQTAKVQASLTAEKIQQNGFADRNTKQVFDDFKNFFSIDKNGALSFKSGQQNAFYDYLKSQLLLNDGQINSLRNLSAREIEKVFQETDGILSNIIKSGPDATQKKANLELKQADLTQSYLAAQNAGLALSRVQEDISDASTNTAEAIGQVNEKIAIYKAQVVEGARGSQEMALMQQEATIATENFRRTLTGANVQLLKQQQQMNTFNGIKNAIVNFLGFNQILNLTRNAIRNALSHIRELDATMNAIAVVTNMTTADLWKQVDAYTAIAQKYGVTIQGAYEVSKIYYQAGYDTNEVLTLTNETLKLSKIAGLDYATTTDYMMTAMRGFKLEMEDASHVVDVYSNLASHTAVSQAELAEAMTRTASSMESVGASFEETSAMIATMVAVTRESANNIGSAMKSIASRYGELKKGQGELVDENGEIIDYNKVDTALKSVGITLKDTNGEFRNFTDVIIELASKWDTLNSVQQRYIATQFAGNRQQSRFLALVSNIELLQENIENAENAEGVGDIQAATTLEGLEAKINQVNVALQEFYTTLGIETAWKTILDSTRNVLNTLNEMPKLFGKIPAAALFVVMNIVNLIKGVLLKGVQNLATVWIQALNNAKKDTEASAQEQQKAGENWINNFIAGIKSGASNMKNVITTIKKDATNAFNAQEFNKASNAANKAKQMETGFQTGFNGGSLLAAAQNQFANLGQYGAGKKGSSFKNDSQQLIAEYNSLIGVCEQYGITVNKNVATLRDLKTSYQELIPQLKNKEIELHNVSIATEEAAKKEELLAKSQQKIARQKFAMNLQQVASGLSTMALLLNNGSRAGEQFSGVLQSIAGMIYVITAAWSTNPIGAVITGITFLVTGLSSIIETTAEKIERLTEEADELRQKATQAQSDQKTLESVSKKYEDLKNKRNESAEAAEEYQEYVNDLASKFPALISGFDEAGNIIIETTNLEYLLAEARKETADATYKAAKKEEELAKAKLEEAKGQVVLPEMNNQRNSNSFNKLRDAFYNVMPNGVPIASESDAAIELMLEDLSYNGDKNGTNQNLGFLYNKDDSLRNIDELKKYFSSVTKEQIEQFSEIEYAFYEYFDHSLIDSETELNDLLTQLYNAYTKDAFSNETMQAYNAVNQKIDEIRQQKGGNALLKDSYSGILTALQNFGTAVDKVNTLDALFSSAIKTTANAWLQKTEKTFDNIDMQNMFLYSVEKAANGESFETWAGENQIKAEELYKKYSDWWKELGNSQATVAKMLETPTLYTYSDFESYLEGADIEIQQGFENRFKTVSEDIKTRLIKQFSSRKINFDFDNKEFTAIDEVFINSQLKLYDTLTKLGLNDSANTLIKQLNNLDFTSQTREILKDANLTSKESVQDVLDSLPNDVDSTLVNFLTWLRDNLIENLSLSLQMAREALAENFENDSKELKKAIEGMSFSEMVKFIESAGEEFNFKDSVVKVGDSYVLTAEATQKYYDKLIKDNYTLSESIKNAGTFFEQLNTSGKTEDFINSLETESGALTETVIRYFEAIGIDINKALQGGLTQDEYDVILTAVTNYKTQLEETGFLAQEAADLLEKAKNDYKKTRMQSAISDYLSGDFTAAKLAENYADLNIDFTEQNAIAFVNRYAQGLDLTTKELNDYAVKAIEKNRHTDIIEAIKDLNVYSKDVAYASIDTVLALANATGKSISELITGQIDAQNNFGVNLQSLRGYESFIEQAVAALYDSLYTSINNIITWSKDGLTKGMSANDAQLLYQEIQKVPGLEQVLIDFKETPEGFKLTEDSVYSIYNGLVAIGSLQADILLRDLAAMVPETKSIADINKQILELQEKQNHVGEEQVAILDAQIAALKQAAKERVLNENSTWNFLSNDVLGAEMNAINFGDEVSKAYGLVDTAIKNNYMSTKDYMQLLVNFNSVASESNPITFLGATLTGNAEDITAALEKLKSVGALVKELSGKGFVVDFKALGDEIDLSAEGLKGSIDNYSNAMIDSAIEVIDAEIKFLEPFAQLEQMSLEIEQSGGIEGFLENQISGISEEGNILHDVLNSVAIATGKDVDKIIDEFKGWDAKQQQKFLSEAMKITFDKDNLGESQSLLAQLFANKGEQPEIVTKLKTDINLNNVPQPLQNMITGQPAMTDLYVNLIYGNQESLNNLINAKANLSLAEKDLNTAKQDVLKAQEKLQKLQESGTATQNEINEAKVDLADAEAKQAEASQALIAAQKTEQDALNEVSQQIVQATNTLSKTAEQETTAVNIFSSAVDTFANAINEFSKEGQSGGNNTPPPPSSNDKELQKDKINNQDIHPEHQLTFDDREQFLSEEKTSKPNNYNISPNQEIFYDEDDIIKAEQDAAAAAARKKAKEEALAAGKQTLVEINKGIEAVAIDAAENFGFAAPQNLYQPQPVSPPADGAPLPLVSTQLQTWITDAGQRAQANGEALQRAMEELNAASQEQLAEIQGVSEEYERFKAKRTRTTNPGKPPIDWGKSAIEFGESGEFLNYVTPDLYDKYFKNSVAYYSKDKNFAEELGSKFRAYYEKGLVANLEDFFLKEPNYRVENQNYPSTTWPMLYGASLEKVDPEVTNLKWYQQLTADFKKAYLNNQDTSGIVNQLKELVAESGNIWESYSTSKTGDIQITVRLKDVDEQIRESQEKAVELHSMPVEEAIKKDSLLTNIWNEAGGNVEAFSAAIQEAGYEIVQTENEIRIATNKGQGTVLAKHGKTAVEPIFAEEDAAALYNLNHDYIYKIKEIYDSLNDVQQEKLGKLLEEYNIPMDGLKEGQAFDLPSLQAALQTVLQTAQQMTNDIQTYSEDFDDADIDLLIAELKGLNEKYTEIENPSAELENSANAAGNLDFASIFSVDDYNKAKEVLNNFREAIEENSKGIKNNNKVSEDNLTHNNELLEEAALTNVDALVKAAQENEDLAFQVKTSGMAISVMGKDSSAAGQQLSAFQSYLSTTASPLRDLEITTEDLISAFRILSSVTPSGVGQAKGNVALAKGTQTLMGELGPELYVTGGRYYVAGQNGAEFVNLPNDAIVFNHLQTKRLLENGSAGRGKAINGENKAVALAKGTGPAKASATQVLSYLKNYKTLLESLKDVSAKDLANAGGGGGGDNDKQLKNVTAEIQRWYNLLRQIDKLEKDISYQEQLRAKIESDRVVNGRAMYSTYKEELKYLDQEIARNKELANLQKSWYDHTREELANSAYGKIFTYDENGLQQYVGDSRPGSGLGLDILENLTQMRVTGEAVGAAKNVKTQLDYLKSVGFDIETLKYNNDGTIIDTKKLKGDKLDEAYVQMMQNFWDSVDGWRDKLDGIYDSYHEQLENVISNEEKRNGLLQEIIDNQLSVEQSVYKAIEEREQAAIDRAQDERDALSDSADKFLDGLSEQLDKERNMYDRNQSSEELNKLRRQLAILQRSGGSASQIRELQNQITSQEQDAYFQAQQDQIDAIKEASDAQLERLDHQIDIMTETLEYQKEHGLLWKEVYDVMAGTPEQIQQFIQENTPDFQSNSALQVMEDLRKLKGEIELWISSRDDSDNPIYTDAGHNWSSYVEASQNRYKDILTDELLAQAKAAFDAEYVRSSDPNAAGAAADAILNKKLEEYNRARGVGAEGSSGGSGTSTSGSGNGGGKYWNIMYPDGKNAGKRYSSKAEATSALNKMIANAQRNVNMLIAIGDNTYDPEGFALAQAELKRLQNSKVFAYKHGGLADYTGLAMVHGSKTRPEAFLNAEQTAMWKNDILGKRNSLTSLLLDFTGALSDLADSNTYNTINRGEAINIDKAEVIMNVGSIANDYDARRAGESALEQMLNIARKTGTRGVSRG